jgi:primosomal protein N' (replication factor Y)
MPPAPGTFVRVPFRKSETVGVVWGVPDAAANLPVSKLKSLGEVLTLPPLAPPLRRLVDWTAHYTLTPLGVALKLAMPTPEVLKTDKPPRAFPLPDPDHAPPQLGDGQAEAFRAVAARPDGFQPFLLDGVTGSGKTEVYFEAVAAALRQGRQALILLPEIALSAQMLTRFANRFGVPPALWHSALTPALRRDTWRAIADGAIRVVIGARSALFLPFAQLGLIVVDEEHDGSYKQEEGVIYNARDLAVVRAREEGIPLVLASATPSLESLMNVEAGRYHRLHLPDRHAGARYPEVAVIDMRKEKLPAGKWLSQPLQQAVRATLERGEQALLFLNRRGYAPLTLCRTCGHRWQCPQCTAWLVAHRRQQQLQCHHCGFHDGWPVACPACAATDSLTPCGPGVERLAEEAAALFPDARLAQVSSDSMASRTAAETLIHQITSGEVNLLVGTQIVAKGYHFPGLTLVGVVDADMGLSGGDLRAAEKTWQMLHQVAGRAGRADKPGRVYLQTFQPDHPVMQTLRRDDRPAFIRQQILERQPAHWPPFGRLVAVIVSAADEGEAQTAAGTLGRAWREVPEVILLGPAPAPLFRLQGRYRFRFLLKASRRVAVQEVLRGWLGGVRVPASVRVQVDVDPYGFM